MKKFPKRIVIYAKDVENLTGRGKRTAYVILQKIKMHYKKTNNEFVTINEFCTYMKMEEKMVKKFLE